MNDAITAATELTPIGAVLVLAALAQVAIVQIAKDRSWSKARAQRVSAIVAAVLGLAAAVVLGMITGIPDSVVQIVSTILLSIAAVAVLWNPVVPFPFAGQGWQLAQLAGAAVFIAAGLTIKRPDPGNRAG